MYNITYINQDKTTKIKEKNGPLRPPAPTGARPEPR